MARIRSPELIGDGGWIGTSAPLSLGKLRGKVVVLHFWSFCCVNCLRVVEELRDLERRYPDECVVIGVHSPKFPHEGEHRALQEAVKRHKITHPVLDDPEMITWQQYGVKGWPTIVVVDPQGYVVGAVPGEGNGDLVRQVVEDLIDEHDRKGTFRRDSVTLIPPQPPTGTLAYPGKVATDRAGRLVISDTGHDRVVVVELSNDGRPDTNGRVLGRITHVVSGLNRPQGVRLYGDELLVCDTMNDRVGRIGLDGDRPEDGSDPDVAGIRRLHFRHYDVISYDVAAPWDIVADFDGTYVVAGAGHHHLWRLTRELIGGGIIAGSGMEGLADGRSERAELAQPSGLTRLPNAVAFVDAESSALRMLTNKGKVATLVGVGMFDWGNRDGRRSRARLQHPRGVVASQDGTALFVADTFNSAIRVWRYNQLSTLGVEGLNEPGGIDLLADGRLVVADTNNHRILFVDPNSGATSELEIEFLNLDPQLGEPDVGETIVGRPGEPLDVPFLVPLDGLYLDPAAPMPVTVTIETDPGWLLDSGPAEWRHGIAEGTVPMTAGSVGMGTIQVTVHAEVVGDGVATSKISVTRHPIHIG